MGTILSKIAAENILQQLPDPEKAEIERDKIRFGEYFIEEENNQYHRVNPINVVVNNGEARKVDDTPTTVI